MSNLRDDPKLAGDRDRDVDVRALKELRRAVNLDGPAYEWIGIAAEVVPDVVRDHDHDHLVAPRCGGPDLQERGAAMLHHAAMEHRAFERAGDVDRAREGV